jgi:hypothetical protein
VTNIANSFAKIFLNALDYFTTFLQKAIKGLEVLGIVSNGTSASIRKMFDDAHKRIDDRATSPEKRERELADIEMDRARKRAAIAKTYNGVMEGLEQQHQNRVLEIDKAQAAEEERIKSSTNSIIAAQAAKVDEARRAWEGAIDKAIEAKQVIEHLDLPLLSPNVSSTQSVEPNKRQQRQLAMLNNDSLSEGKRARIERNLGQQGINVAAYRAAQNGTDGVSEAMKNVTSRGTFNPMALQALQVGGMSDVAQKQLDEAKKTREEQKKQTQSLKSIENNVKRKGYMTFA